MRAPRSGIHRTSGPVPRLARSNTYGDSRKTAWCSVITMSWIITGAGRSIATLCDSVPSAFHEVVAEVGLEQRVAERHHLARARIESGMGRHRSPESTAEVVLAHRVEVTRHLRGQAAFPQGEPPSGVLDDVGVGRVLHRTRSAGEGAVGEVHDVAQAGVDRGAVRDLGEQAPRPDPPVAVRDPLGAEARPRAASRHRRGRCTGRSARRGGSGRCARTTRGGPRGLGPSWGTRRRRSRRRPGSSCPRGRAGCAALVTCPTSGSWFTLVLCIAVLLRRRSGAERGVVPVDHVGGRDSGVGHEVDGEVAAGRQVQVDVAREPGRDRPHPAQRFEPDRGGRVDRQVVDQLPDPRARTARCRRSTESSWSPLPGSPVSVFFTWYHPAGNLLGIR